MAKNDQASTTSDTSGSPDAAAQPAAASKTGDDRRGPPDSERRAFAAAFMAAQLAAGNPSHKFDFAGLATLSFAAADALLAAESAKP